MGFDRRNGRIYSSFLTLDFNSTLLINVSLIVIALILLNKLSISKIEYFGFV